MLRNFQLTVTNSPQNLWDLIVAAGYCDNLGNVLISAVKNGEILADRGFNLDISTNTANTNQLIIQDRFGGSFNSFAANTNFNKTSNRNTICYKDYFLVTNTGTCIANVSMESM